jgi:hypothetical protein
VSPVSDSLAPGGPEKRRHGRVPGRGEHTARQALGNVTPCWPMYLPPRSL